MWRKLGGLLVALTLVFLASGPSIGDWLWRDDLAAHPVAESSLQADLGPLDEVSDRGGVCLQGHCHHVAPTGAPSMVSAAVEASAYRHPMVEVALPPGLPPFELMRPPRG